MATNKTYFGETTGNKTTTTKRRKTKATRTPKNANQSNTENYVTISVPATLAFQFGLAMGRASAETRNNR